MTGPDGVIVVGPDDSGEARSLVRSLVYAGVLRLIGTVRDDHGAVIEERYLPASVLCCAPEPRP
jgi:hypothetical protein